MKKRQSLYFRLMLVVVATVLISSVLVGASSVVYYSRYEKAALLSGTRATLRSVAYTISAALEFDDKRVILEQFQFLEGQVDFVRVRILGERGEVYAQRDFEKKGPGRGWEKKDFFEERVPIVNDAGKALGTLEGVVSMARVDDLILRYIIGLAGIMFGSALVSIFFVTLSVRKVLRPMFLLNEALEKMAESKTIETVQVVSDDEIGLLAKTFNAMVSRLRGVQEKLVRSEKLAAIGSLASSVAHELRDPLQSMKNAVYLMSLFDMARHHPRFQETLDLLTGQINKSRRIMDDILEFARRKEPNRKAGSLNSLVEKVANAWFHESGVEVRLDLDKNFPKVSFDDAQMEQVLMNLLSNAAQAMANKGVVMLSTRSRQGHAEIRVADTGVGIPEENIEKIFDPLFSTKSKGSGLGLAVCQSIVESHGWTISAGSKQGEGATFTIKIPLDPDV